MQKVRCYIGLGSNLDEPVRQIRSALAELALLPESELIVASRLYRSVPMGPQDQPDYINAVASLDTRLGPHELLDQLQSLEAQHQRLRERHWGPRTLDLDVLLYGEQTFNDARLTVPHAGLAERNFVLYPLQDVMEADRRIPGLGTLQQLLGQVTADGLELLDT